MPGHHFPLAIATAADWAAHHDRRAAHFHAKADAATDWTERDRLRACAHTNEDEARRIRIEFRPAYRSELTPIGEQLVIPGCEQNAAPGKRQLDLF
jgi:hypothetical protein